MKCERCGKTFEVDVEREEFENEMTSYCYDYIAKELCAKCSIEAIEDLEGGVYFEICEKCGKKYDLIEDNAKFEHMHSDGEYGSYASIGDLTNKLLCIDCAIDEYNK